MPATRFKDQDQTSPENEVRRVLRHRSSREYFKDGGWTPDPREARTFVDVVEAAETCARHGLSNVELALRYDSVGHDLFATPLR